MIAFSYHRGIAPMIWVLLGLSAIEMMVVHGLIALWWPALGLVLIAVSLSGMVWLVLLLRSLPRRPVLVGEGRVLMRVGTLHEIVVPADAIAGFRADWTADSLKDRRIARLSLLAYPNVVLELNRPLRVGRREVAAVAHRLDDPEGFVATVHRLAEGA